MDDAVKAAYSTFPAVAERCPAGVLIEEGVLENQGASAEADPANCRVRWAISSFSRPSGAYIDYCQIMVHEFGHIAGLPHSGDPTSLMYDPDEAPDGTGVEPPLPTPCGGPLDRLERRVLRAEDRLFIRRKRAQRGRPGSRVAARRARVHYLRVQEPMGPIASAVLPLVATAD